MSDSWRSQLAVTTSPLGSQKDYIFVAIISHHQGKLLLSRHKQRDTWEHQGGHIEPGETADEAAARELFEESGATEYQLRPVCDYSANGTHGVVYAAAIEQLGPLPESEMAEVKCFGALPANLTYALATPALLQAVVRADNPAAT